MEILVDISDSQVSGIKRKVKVRKFTLQLEDGDESLQIEVEIFRYKNESGEYGDQIPFSPEYPSFRKTFAASDLDRLNPETGDLLGRGDLSVGIGEFTATIAKVSETYDGIPPLNVVIGLIVQSVQVADQRGRFNE